MWSRAHLAVKIYLYCVNWQVPIYTCSLHFTLTPDGKIVPGDITLEHTASIPEGWTFEPRKPKVERISDSRVRVRWDDEPYESPNDFRDEVFTIEHRGNIIVFEREESKSDARDCGSAHVVGVELYGITESGKLLTRRPPALGWLWSWDGILWVTGAGTTSEDYEDRTFEIRLESPDSENMLCTPEGDYCIYVRRDVEANGTTYPAFPCEVSAELTCRYSGECDVGVACWNREEGDCALYMKSSNNLKILRVLSADVGLGLKMLAVPVDSEGTLLPFDRFKLNYGGELKFTLGAIYVRELHGHEERAVEGELTIAQAEKADVDISLFIAEEYRNGELRGLLIEPDVKRKVRIRCRDGEIASIEEEGRESGVYAFRVGNIVYFRTGGRDIIAMYRPADGLIKVRDPQTVLVVRNGRLRMPWGSVRAVCGGRLSCFKWVAYDTTYPISERWTTWVKL